MGSIDGGGFSRDRGAFRSAPSHFSARAAAFRSFLLAVSLLAVSLPLQAQTELGVENDLTVLGTNGTALDPNVELKGFTVFGSTQAAYPGAVVGPGDVVVNGALAVSSGAYFTGVSTFSTGMYVMAAASFTDVANIYITGGADNQVLAKNGANGPLKWTNTSALGDNLGNHTATQNLNMNTFNMVNVSSVNFLSNVFLTSATAALGGGVYVSTNMYVVGYSSAAGYYGDGSTLANVSTHTYRIGDHAGGGIVYWVDPTGTRVLIAAAADQGAGIPWGINTNATGAVLDGVYAGRADTVMISTMQGPGNYAARLCQDYAVTGADGVYYDDWYLPSVTELQLLYAQRTAVGGFTVTGYWSSTEYVPTTTTAWYVGFQFGGANSLTLKTNSYYVRCVRGGPFSAFDYSRDAETVRNGAYVTSTQTFTGANTFQMGVTASSFTATGTGFSGPQLNLANNVVVSSEASAALGAGVRVSSNVYIVGFSSAAKYYGDGSGLTGILTAGDNLGNHTATQALDMNNFAIRSSSDITAAHYQIGGSTVLAIFPVSSSLAVGVLAGGTGAGSFNSFVGYQAGYSNDTGGADVFVGYQAGQNNIAGLNNTFVGAFSGRANINGRSNAFLGNNTGQNLTGTGNTLLGSAAGFSGAASSYSSATLVGYATGGGLTTGNNNILVGWRAGYGLTTGGDNIVIGYNQDAPTPASNYALNIGGVLYGDLSAKTIGISTRAPQAALDIVSTGTAANIYAQIWRDGGGVVVGSMSATGVMTAAKFIGDGTGLTGVGSSAGASNLLGGLANEVPYQTAANTTAFTAQPGANMVLFANNGAPGWTNAPALTGTNITSIPGGNVTGSITGGAGLLNYRDLRTIKPSDEAVTTLRFGFTSFANNNTLPYADYLHLRSYIDASGGNDNLVMFRKDAIGMRIWQQAFGSATPYAAYKDVAFTDGTNATGSWPISITGTSAGAAPSGAAGGNLGGTYPNPSIASLPAISGAALTNLTGANVTGTVASSTNSDKLDGFHAADLQFYQSDRDFPAGTLIQSNIDYSVTNGEPFLLEIDGNSYNSLIPFDIKVQGYIYSDTIINPGGISNGTNLTGLVAFNYLGKLCFWFPSQGYWQGFSVNINDSYGGIKKNRLVSVSNAAKPGGVTKEVAFTVRQSLHDGNFNSYAPTLTGTGASGSWPISITGTSAGAAPSGAAGGNLSGTYPNPSIASLPAISGAALTSLTGANVTGAVANATTAANLTNFSVLSGVNPDTKGTTGVQYFNGGGTSPYSDGALYQQAWQPNPTTWGSQIMQDYRTGRLAVRGLNNATWTAWLTMIDSGNFNSYAPTLTGTGASGTWPISISGTSAGAAPSGAAGGNLGGTYPNPSIASLPAISGAALTSLTAGNISAGTAGISVTGNAATATKLNAQGNYDNAAPGTTRGPAGLNLFQVYANGYPTTYGNILHLNGTGAGQLLVGWSGTDGANADNYIRSKRDNDAGAWSPWAKILTDVNYNTYAPTLTGTGASGTWPISISGSAASAGAAAFANITGIPIRTAWSGVHRNFVAEQLSWKNYGNNHTIFDASAGTSPDGVAVNNTNAAVAWSATYPTLMGWNGASTYGVRVDSARVADSVANADTVDGYHMNQDVRTGQNVSFASVRKDVDNSEPKFKFPVYGANGDLPFHTTSNSPVTMRLVYGPFSYSMLGCQAGATRYYKLYAEVVDNITSGGQQVYLRMNFTAPALNMDFNLGSTWGGSPSYHSYISGAFTDAVINTSHANIQLWVNGANGPFAELRRAEVWMYCAN